MEDLLSSHIAQLESTCISPLQRHAVGLETSSRSLKAVPPQLHFNWAEEAVAAGSSASDCFEPHRDGNNLVYQKPYATNIPAYRRVTPKGSM